MGCRRGRSWRRPTARRFRWGGGAGAVRRRRLERSTARAPRIEPVARRFSAAGVILARAVFALSRRRELKGQSARGFHDPRKLQGHSARGFRDPRELQWHCARGFRDPCELRWHCARGFRDPRELQWHSARGFRDLDLASSQPKRSFLATAATIIAREVAFQRRARRFLGVGSPCGGEDGDDRPERSFPAAAAAISTGGASTAGDQRSQSSVSALSGQNLTQAYSCPSCGDNPRLDRQLRA